MQEKTGEKNPGTHATVITKCASFEYLSKNTNNRGNVYWKQDVSVAMKAL